MPGSRAFEVCQFATKSRNPVSCAAFSPDAGKGGPNSFAVSASGPNIYKWSIPTPAEVIEHRIENVPLTLLNQNVDTSTQQVRIGFEVNNKVELEPPSSTAYSRQAVR